MPGSHLWDHTRRPKTEEVVAAEMTVGEAFLFLGSTVHAGGANRTSQSRPMHGFFYCRSWMRPEVRTLYANTLLQGSRTLRTSCSLLKQDELMRLQENQHMWWTKDEVQQWSLAAQKQAGYVLDNPFLGHCDETNPVDVVRVDTDSGR